MRISLYSRNFKRMLATLILICMTLASMSYGLGDTQKTAETNTFFAGDELDLMSDGQTLVGESIGIFKYTTELSSIPHDGSFDVKAVYKNYSYDVIDITYIVTVTSNNRLLSVATAPYSFAPYEEHCFTNTIVIPENTQNIQIKTMIWADLDGLIPVCAPLIKAYDLRNYEYAVVLNSSYDEEQDAAFVKLAFTDNSVGTYEVSDFYQDEGALFFAINSKFASIYKCAIVDGKADLSADRETAANRYESESDCIINAGDFYNKPKGYCYPDEDSVMFFLYNDDEAEDIEIKAKAFRLKDINTYLYAKPVTVPIAPGSSYNQTFGNVVCDNSGEISVCKVGVMTCGNSLPVLISPDNVAYLASARRSYNIDTDKWYLEVGLISAEGHLRYATVDEPIDTFGNISPILNSPAEHYGTMVRYNLNSDYKITLIDNTLGTITEMQKPVNAYPGFYYVNSAFITDNVLGYYPYGTAVQTESGVLPEANASLNINKDCEVITVKNYKYAGNYFVPASRSESIGANDFNAIIQKDSNGEISKIISFDKSVGARDIVSAEDYEDMVPTGTELGNVPLPKLIDVALSDNSVIGMPVTWDLENASYNGNVSGEYEVEGIFNPPSNVSNSIEIKAKAIIRVRDYAVVLNSSYDAALNTAVIRLAFTDNTEGTYTVSDFYTPLPTIPESEYNDKASDFQNNAKFGYIYECEIENGFANLSLSAGISPTQGDVWAHPEGFYLNSQRYQINSASVLFMLNGILDFEYDYRPIKAKAYRFEDIIFEGCASPIYMPYPGSPIDSNLVPLYYGNAVINDDGYIPLVSVGVMTAGEDQPPYIYKPSGTGCFISSTRKFNIETLNWYYEVAMITESGYYNLHTIDELGFDRTLEYGDIVDFNLNADNKICSINCFTNGYGMRQPLYPNTYSGYYYINVVALKDGLLGYFPYGTPVDIYDGVLPATNYALNINDECEIITIDNHSFAGNDLILAPRDECIGENDYNAIVKISKGEAVQVYSFKDTSSPGMPERVVNVEDYYTAVITGTELSEVSLRDSVEVALADGSSENLPVIWDLESTDYDANTPGLYCVEGTLFTDYNDNIDACGYKARTYIEVCHYGVVLASSYDMGTDTAFVKLAFADNTEGTYRVSKTFMPILSAPMHYENDLPRRFSYNSKFGYIYKCRINNGLVDLSPAEGYCPSGVEEVQIRDGVISGFSSYTASDDAVIFLLYGKMQYYDDGTPFEDNIPIKAGAYKLSDITSLDSMPIMMSAPGEPPRGYNNGQFIFFNFTKAGNTIKSAVITVGESMPILP